MRTFLILTLTVSSSFCQQFKPYKLYGETNYQQQENKSLGTSLNGEYRVIIHEPKHKDYTVYVGGKIVLDYDHFGNELKTNTFTTIGVDF